MLNLLRLAASGADAGQQLVDGGAGADIHQRESVGAGQEIAGNDTWLALIEGVEEPKVIRDLGRELLVGICHTYPLPRRRLFPSRCCLVGHARQAEGSCHARICHELSAAHRSMGLSKAARTIWGQCGGNDRACNCRSLGAYIALATAAAWGHTRSML